MSSDESGDSQTELEASAGIVASGAVDAAGGGPLGLQLVFPELRPEAVAPTAGVPLVLGRDGDGDGRLSGSEISRRHGELRVAGDRLVLRDLGSSNGLFVNGARCPEAALALGDVVRMGEWVGVVVPLQAAPVVDDLHLGPIARPVVLRAARVARTRLPVLIEGETGTGKERLARAIHEWSERPGPFIAVDSATLTGPQAEGELFAQHGGSLFLDEVTHLPPESQPLLLRALAAVAGESPAGAGPGAPDVRLLAATRVPLAGAAERGFLRRAAGPARALHPAAAAPARAARRRARPVRAPAGPARPRRPRAVDPPGGGPVRLRLALQRPGAGPPDRAAHPAAWPRSRCSGARTCPTASDDSPARARRRRASRAARSSCRS